MINYWWVTRPKRKLDSIPQVLALFAKQAIDQVWNGQRTSHLSIEEALEESGLKRTGLRRDHTGGGGRTYMAWLKSLGLLFQQKETKEIKLTLAGEAIMNGESPVEILRDQIIKYQIPSSFSISRGVNVSRRFKVHPFWFLFRLLTDDRLGWLTQEEIAKIVITEGESDKENCIEKVIGHIIRFREEGDQCLDKDFIEKYKTSKGMINLTDPYGHLRDVANTLVNWLEYTQYITRDDGKITILDDARKEAERIAANPPAFIARPDDEEFFQRRYGLDPHHKKDTRNLLDTHTITPKIVAEMIVKQAFVELTLEKPIMGISGSLVNEITEKTGLDQGLVAETLEKYYPHGAVSAFLSTYFNMAFNGKEECRDFEIATANIFKDIFHFTSRHIAGGAKEVPDVLLVSDEDGWQAIIDTKAYSRYELPADQRDRMIYHYLPEIGKYSDSPYPLAFFSYIAGGFKPTIDKALEKIVQAAGINGSAMPVRNFIRLAEMQNKHPYTHREIRNIFSLNKRIDITDIERPQIQ
jgi:hypothetical protein